MRMDKLTTKFQTALASTILIIGAAVPFMDWVQVPLDTFAVCEQRIGRTRRFTASNWSEGNVPLNRVRN